ncbi:MAG: hypothetical protein ACI9C2_001147 [Gammaproteobacteria bacterium]|jgi:hypothetical protein
MKSLVLPTLLIGLTMASPSQDFPFEFPEDPNLKPAEAEIRETLPEHRLLREEVGTWNATIRSFLAPGMPPTESKGVLTSELLGEGWLVSEFVGSALGEELRFRRTVGFDGERNRATGVLIDPDAANVCLLDGTYDANLHKRTLTYELKDLHGVTRSYKSVEKTVDAENRTFFLFEVMESTEEVPVLLVNYELIAR